jgi:hypothetical protein
MNISLDSLIHFEYIHLEMNTLDSKLTKFRRQFRGRAPYYGFYSEVARECCAWPSHVRRVFLGLSTSQRVTRAIAVAIERWNMERKER